MLVTPAAEAPSNFATFAAIRRASSLVSSFAAEIDLAFVSSGPNARPKAKDNGRPDHERDHNCVPQRHGATDDRKRT
jgi:hypothetical protein